MCSNKEVVRNSTLFNSCGRGGGARFYFFFFLFFHFFFSVSVFRFSRSDKTQNRTFHNILRLFTFGVSN